MNKKGTKQFLKRAIDLNDSEIKAYFFKHSQTNPKKELRKSRSAVKFNKKKSQTRIPSLIDPTYEGGLNPKSIPQNYSVKALKPNSNNNKLNMSGYAHPSYYQPKSLESIYLNDKKGSLLLSKLFNIIRF